MSLTVSAYPSGQNSDPNAVYDSFNQMAYGSNDDPKMSYDSWNGDFAGFLQYIGEHGSDSDRDRWLNYLENENSANIAREWTAGREDTQYQRLVADLKAAGINPYALINSNASPVSSSSSGSSYSGSYGTNEALKKEANSQKWIALITGILSSVIMAAAIAI